MEIQPLNYCLLIFTFLKYSYGYENKQYGNKILQGHWNILTEETKN